MKKYEAKNCRFKTLPEGSGSNVSCTILFDATDITDVHNPSFPVELEISGLAFNSTLTDLVNAVKTETEAYIQKLNVDEKSLSLADALSLVAQEIPHMTLAPATTSEDTL